jgi:hypothetical protein
LGHKQQSPQFEIVGQVVTHPTNFQLRWATFSPWEKVAEGWIKVFDSSRAEFFSSAVARHLFPLETVFEPYARNCPERCAVLRGNAVFDPKAIQPAESRMRLRWRVVLWTALILCVALLLYGPVAIQSAREAARREKSSEYLKQMRVALDAYMQREKSGGQIPLKRLKDEAGPPLIPPP